MDEKLLKLGNSEECPDNFVESCYSIFRGVCTYKNENLEVGKSDYCVHKLSSFIGPQINPNDLFQAELYIGKDNKQNE